MATLQLPALPPQLRVGPRRAASSSRPQRRAARRRLRQPRARYAGFAILPVARAELTSSAPDRRSVSRGRPARERLRPQSVAGPLLASPGTTSPDWRVAEESRIGAL